LGLCGFTRAKTRRNAGDVCCIAVVSAFELAHHDSGAGAIALVSLEGELDLTNVTELEQRLTAACPPERPLVVDLNHVAFVDSAALHCFFRLARSRGRSRLAFVVDPASPIARTLSIVDLGGTAAIASTLDSARDALNGTDTP
jgi:anti-anti-sigma factor